MTLDELIKSLGLDTDENKDKAETLKKEFNALQSTIATQKKDNKKLSDSNASLQTIADRYDIVKTAFDFDEDADDFDAMLENVKDTFSKANGGGVTPEEVKALKRDITKANRERDKALEQFKNLDTQYKEEKAQRIKSNIRNEVSKALNSNNVIKPDQMVDLFANRVAVDEDGVTFTIRADNGNELSIGDYIADWSKENPEFVKSSSKGGAGSTGGNGGKQPTDSGQKSEVGTIMEALLKGGHDAGDRKPLEELFR